MDNFIQITVFCPPEPRIGAFVYRNAGKVYKDIISNNDEKHYTGILISVSIFLLIIGHLYYYFFHLQKR